MPDDDKSGRQWIVEPPLAPGEVSLYLAVGDDAELTPEQEAALTELLASLERSDAEVSGHTKCTEDTVFFCVPQLQCGKVKCGILGCKLVKGVAAASGSGGSWELMGSFTPGLA